MRPTKTKGECNHCYNINETTILAQIEEIIKKIAISKNVLEEIQTELKKAVKSDHKHKTQEITKLTKELSKVQERLKNTRTLYIDKEFTQEEYQEIKTDLEVERQNITTKLTLLQKEDEDFNKNIVSIFELASRSHEIFKSSEVEEKRRIINILFPNLKSSGKNLVFTMRKPFDMMVNLDDRPDWLRTHPCDRTITLIKNLNYEGIEQGTLGQEVQSLQPKQEVKPYIIKHDLDCSRQGIEEVLSPKNHSNNPENTRNSHYHNTKDMNLLISNMIQADIFSYGLNQINSIARI